MNLQGLSLYVRKKRPLMASLSEPLAWVAFTVPYNDLSSHYPKQPAVPPEAYPLLPVSPFSIFCLSTDPDTSVCPSQWVPPGPGRQQGCWDRAAASMKKVPGGAPSSRLGLCLMPVLCCACPEGPSGCHLPPLRPPGAQSLPLSSILSQAEASLPPLLPLRCSVAHEKPEDPLRISTQSHRDPHPAHGKT